MDSRERSRGSGSWTSADSTRETAAPCRVLLPAHPDGRGASSAPDRPRARAPWLDRHGLDRRRAHCSGRAGRLVAGERARVDSYRSGPNPGAAVPVSASSPATHRPLARASRGATPLVSGCCRQGLGPPARRAFRRSALVGLVSREQCGRLAAGPADRRAVGSALQRPVGREPIFPWPTAPASVRGCGCR